MDQLYNIQRSDNITVVVPQEHQHTLIWIHGLNQHHEKHMNYVIEALKLHARSVKIIIPRAPNRFVTCMNSEASSWFDVKPRSQKSFLVPFDEAFSTSEVIESYEKILKPIIVKEGELVKQLGGKLIVCGFSQGGGMSLHCLYNLPDLVSAAIGISGYLFPFTPFDSELKNKVHIIYGTADDLRPWQYTKTTYEGKIPPTKMTFGEGMKHAFDENTVTALTEQLQQILAVS